MEKLYVVRRRASDMEIAGTIYISTRKNKKYMIELSNGDKIHFGDSRYKDFLDHKVEIRKIRFHNRFKNIKGYNNKKSGLYYSRKLLW